MPQERSKLTPRSVDADIGYRRARSLFAVRSAAHNNGEVTW